MHHWARLLSLSLLIYLFATSAGDPTFPKLRDIAESFESNVELTSQVQNTTALVNEYYDFQDQTGRMDILLFGQKIKYFFYGQQDQVYAVEGDTCTEDDGGVAEIDMKFYGWTSKDPLFVGPSSLIKMRENDPPEFAGIANVRGISCNWFRSSKDDGNITVDYYFSVPEWDMPYTTFSEAKTFPVRITVRLIAENDWQEEMMDYLYFRPGFSDKSMYQPSVGLGCWMKTPTAKLPEIPDQYTFGFEVFDLRHDAAHAETDVVSGQIWYDYRLKYARMDKYTSSGKISDLHDFRTGVLYHMHDDRTCVFKTMRNSFFLKFDSDSLVGQMKEPYEVLNLQGDDETFYTMGQGEVRGVKCNIYEKVQRNVTFFKQDYKLLVTTAYFTTPKTQSQVDGEDIEFTPPLAILITGYDENDKVTYKKQFQIYSFNDEPGREFFSTYRSAECFPLSNQKSYFVIFIDAPFEIATELEGKDYQFANLARDTIISDANITDFRLPFLRVDFRETGIYIEGLMLDRPALLAYFWKENFEKTFVEKMSAYKVDIDASTEESCAAACLDYTEPCKGFHFCGEACFINLGELMDEPIDNNPINQNCDIYVRAVSDSKNDQASLEQAFEKLKTAKENKTLKFRALIKGEQDVLTATKIITSFNNRGGDDVNNYPYTLVKSGFQFKGDVETTVEVPDAQSEMECYRYCKESTDIACASFSYCAKASNKMCRITSVLLNDTQKDSSEVDVNPKCDVFSLLFLDLFEPYPGKVVVIPGEKKVEDMYNTEKCAQACKEETGFRCRGFEYCRAKRTCVLHSKHVLDLKPEESLPSKSECFHYAAKYSADYRDMGLLLIDDESNRRTEISLEECSRACSEEVESCNSFNYCPPSAPKTGDSSCSMTSMTLYDAAKTKTKEKCHLYTKREHIEDWKRPPRSKKPKAGYTSKSFAGLVVGMLILGLVIGALAFVGYSYFRSRKGGSDGLTVKFSKQDDM